MAIQKGGEIAQLLLLPYISINSSNDLRTGGFSSTDQKQSLWISLVSEFAQLNIIIKFNGKRFSGLLNTGSNTAIISKHLWPNPSVYKKPLPNCRNFSNQSTRSVSKCSKSTHVRDQKANLKH